jgi:hypothetical protein
VLKWNDSDGTVRNALRVGLNRSTLDASGLTAARAHALPDAAGTVLVGPAALTAGSVLYAGAGGVVAQEANLSYDAANDTLTVLGSANARRLVLRSSGTQSVPLQEWQGSGGAVLAAVYAGGNASFSTPSANGGIVSGFLNVSNVLEEVYRLAHGSSAVDKPRGVTNWSHSRGGSGYRPSTHIGVVDSATDVAGTAAHGFDGRVGATLADGIAGNVTALANGDIAAFSNLNTTVMSVGAVGPVTVKPAATSSGLIVQGAASQSGNLTEWKDSSGAVLSTVSENGYFTTRKTAAPADAELATSELSFYLDNTAGFPRPTFKGKDSAGAAFTAPVMQPIFKWLNADATGTNVATAQPWFPTAGGVSLKASTSYEFEGRLYLTRAAGTVSHTTGILFGGTATLTSIEYLACGSTATGNALSAISSIAGTAATLLVVTAASAVATENVEVWVRGVVRVNAAGTFIPQFQYSVAPGGAPTIKSGSFFILWELGSNTVTSAGAWA